MGFLLMQYEYQRANAKVSLHQRAGIRLDNKLDRITKRISKMESVFSKAKTRVESKWQQASNRFSAIISAAANNSANLEAALGNIVIGNTPLSAYVTVPSTSGTTDSSAILQAVTTAAAQAKSIMATLIQQAQEAETELLEAKEEEQMLPISEQEIDIQAEQSTNDTLTTLWEQRRDAAKQKLGDSIENSVAHFGIK